MRALLEKGVETAVEDEVEEKEVVKPKEEEVGGVFSRFSRVFTCPQPEAKKTTQAQPMMWNK